MVYRVFIVGLNHEYQYDGYKADTQKFSAFLTHLCQEKDIDLIGEELSEESIQKWNATGSVARNVANTLTISHLFCDPDTNERGILGIKITKEIIQELGYDDVLTPSQAEKVDRIEKSYHPIRRSFWLQKLLEHRFERCVFILGSDHVDAFCDLLKTHQIHCEIIDRKWQLNNIPKPTQQ